MGHIKFGWGSRNRTCAWRSQSPVPYRLAIPHRTLSKIMVSPQGFEPRTHGLEGRCSIQLSYEPTLQFKKWSGWWESNSRHQLGRLRFYHWTTSAKWSGRRDSNSRPSPWQGDALPLSHSRKWCPEAESNHRHEDFQSSALPTELSGHIIFNFFNFYIF